MAVALAAAVLAVAALAPAAAQAARLQRRSGQQLVFRGLPAQQARWHPPPLLPRQGRQLLR